MTDPSAALGLIQNIVDSASNYYEFWKDYQGEEILIRSTSVEFGGEGQRGVGRNVFVIRGKVKDITSYPPGFLLEEVEEYIEMSEVNLLHGWNPTEPADAKEGTQAKQTLREVDEKYVSFSSIEEVERAESAESAIEPFRED
ncbi:hypothetical protein [Halolamina sp.]|uniref:hypothetical protein n=1 Tax=Halolamina sp. TaxID=1940283 RepID=UPI003565EBCE